MNLSQNRRLRLLTLCALYVAQGIPFGFVTILLKAYLVDEGVSMEGIGGLIALSTYPWAFKWVWGPVIDRFGLPAMGHRRPWILLAQFFMVLTIAAMIFVPNATTSVVVLGYMAMTHNIFNALQDVAVDALAIDLLEEKERGRANGLMFGSKYLGTLIGGYGLNAVLNATSLRVTLLVQVGILFAVMLFPLLFRERAGEKLLPWTPGRAMAPPEDRPVASLAGLMKILLGAFSHRGTILAGVFAFGAYFGNAVLSNISTEMMMEHLGWSRDEFVWLTGLWGILLSAAVCFGSGFLADVLSPRRLVGLSTMLLGLVWIGYAFTPTWWTVRPFMIVMSFVEAILMSTLAVSMFALFMSICLPRVAATQFTVYMAILNLSTAQGSKWTGAIDQFMKSQGADFARAFLPAAPLDGLPPYQAAYLALGALQAALAVLLIFIDPKQIARAFKRELP